jgi:hypothetical protein
MVMIFVGFMTLETVVMKDYTVWGVKPCNPLKVNRNLFYTEYRERYYFRQLNIYNTKAILKYKINSITTYVYSYTGL